MVQMIHQEIGPAARQGDGKTLRIVAKSLYRELRQGGYSPTQVVSLTSELISLVTEELREDDEGPHPEVTP